MAPCAPLPSVEMAWPRPHYGVPRSPVDTFFDWKSSTVRVESD
jgi:hypothetical protein